MKNKQKEQMTVSEWALTMLMMMIDQNNVNFEEQSHFLHYTHYIQHFQRHNVVVVDLDHVVPLEDTHE